MVKRISPFSVNSFSGSCLYGSRGASGSAVHFPLVRGLPWPECKDSDRSGKG